MSEIIKTEAVVLSKLNYGDTSSIVTLYSKDFGKFSAIIKGGRSPKSKIGLIIEPLNYIQVIVYIKESRELQFISGSDMISYFPGIREDFDKLKYSQAVIELLKKLTAEHEINVRLFKGVVRIISLIESSNELPVILFSRFLFFFLTELGYGLHLDKCPICGRTNLGATELSYNYEFGIFCGDCKKNHLETGAVTPELFNYLLCLKTSKKIEANRVGTAETAITFMEKHLIYHVPDFKGIQTLRILK